MFLSESAQQWAKLLDPFSQVKISMALFCWRKGVSQAAFYYWRRKLQRIANASEQTDQSLPTR